MSTRTKMLLGLAAGILINVVMLISNFDKGGWWRVWVPAHLTAIGVCSYAFWLWWRQK